MKKENIILVTALIIIISLIVLLQFKSESVGKSYYPPTLNYTENINREYTSNTVFLWIPENNIKINGLAVDGNVSGIGNVKVFLIYDSNLFLINEFSLHGEEVSFSDSCTQSCELPSLNSDKYLIRLEFDGLLTYNLNSITYSNNAIQ